MGCVKNGVFTIADYPKAIDIYNIAQLPLSADHIPEGFRSLTLRPVFDLSDSLSGWVAVLGIYPAMFMGRASKRFIDISVAQFKVNVLHQHERHLGLSEQAIHALKHYLYHGGLTFFYQPIVSLKQGECHKFEALARLYDDQGNLIAPGQFLPHFGYKEIKFIFLEGLKQTLTQLKQWQQQGFLFEINLNLPPELLIDPNCVLWIADALDTYHIEAKRLHLELLENEAISDDKQRAQAIKALNQLGVSLKMDDLGSGHSGLIRLKELPFSGIKIDQQLVRDLETPKVLKVISILSGLLNMTQQMQLNATVEGLETDDEIEIMTILGADYGQGYQIAKPMPADQVLPWLANMQWPYNPLKPKTHLGKLLLLQQRIDEACEKQRLENTGESCLLPAHDTTLSSIHSGTYQQLCQQLAQHNFLAARLSNYQLIETYVTQQRHAFDNAQTSLES